MAGDLPIQKNLSLTALTAPTALEGLVDSLPIQNTPAHNSPGSPDIPRRAAELPLHQKHPMPMTALTVLGGPIGTYPIQSIPRPLQFRHPWEDWWDPSASKTSSATNSTDSPWRACGLPPHSKHPDPPPLTALTALTALGRMVGSISIQNPPPP